MFFIDIFIDICSALDLANTYVLLFFWSVQKIKSKKKSPQAQRSGVGRNCILDTASAKLDGK